MWLFSTTLSSIWPMVSIGAPLAFRRITLGRVSSSFPIFSRVNTVAFNRLLPAPVSTRAATFPLLILNSAIRVLSCADTVQISTSSTLASSSGGNGSHGGSGFSSRTSRASSLHPSGGSKVSSFLFVSSGLWHVSLAWSFFSLLDTSVEFSFFRIFGPGSDSSSCFGPSVLSLQADRISFLTPLPALARGFLVVLLL